MIRLINREPLRLARDVAEVELPEVLADLRAAAESGVLIHVASALRRLHGVEDTITGSLIGVVNSAQLRDVLAAHADRGRKLA